MCTPSLPLIQPYPNNNVLQEEEEPGLFTDLNRSLMAASVLDASITVQMKSEHMSKAGVVIENCQTEGYSDPEINAICRALFLSQTEDDMMPAWKVFNKDDPERGPIDTKLNTAVY